jgi:hypothetical protein
VSGALKQLHGGHHRNMAVQDCVEVLRSKDCPAYDSGAQFLYVLKLMTLKMAHKVCACMAFHGSLAWNCFALFDALLQLAAVLSEYNLSKPASNLDAAEYHSCLVLV